MSQGIEGVGGGYKIKNEAGVWKSFTEFAICSTTYPAKSHLISITLVTSPIEYSSAMVHPSTLTWQLLI